MPNIQEVLQKKNLKNVEHITSGNDVNTSLVSNIINSSELKPQKIDYSYLYVSRFNTYSVNNEEVEELAESIANLGMLLEYLIVEKVEEDRYEILSGQKRYLAISKLKSENEKIFLKVFPKEKIPCKVIDFNTFKVKNGSQILSDDSVRLMIIAEANNQREQTTRDYMLRITQLQEVYKELKQKGMIEYSRTREFIADNMGLKTRSIQKVLTAKTRMLPDLWNQLLTNENLSSVQMLESLSLLPDAVQDFLLQELKSGNPVDLREYTEQKNTTKTKPSIIATNINPVISQQRLLQLFSVQEFTQTAENFQTIETVSEEDAQSLEKIHERLTKLNLSAIKILKKYQK